MFQDSFGRLMVKAGDSIKEVTPYRVTRDLERVLYGSDIAEADFLGYDDEDMTTPVIRVRSRRVPRPIVNL